MARNYHRERYGKYILPRAVYHQTIWRIRDYYRLKEEAAALITYGSQLNDPVRSCLTSDRVGSVVVKREKVLKDVELIDECLLSLPEEYRKGVWDNVQHNRAFPLDASRATYARYKSYFLYKVAESFGLIW